MPIPLPQNATRLQVKKGIAAYFGGTFVQNIRAYQNGPINSYGLGTVRAGLSKRLDLNNFVANQAKGRGMGAYMIVELGRDKETRRSEAGAPVTDAGGNIIAGGIKFIRYRVTLNVFHLAHKAYAEDAADDIEQLIEAIKQLIRLDRTLGTTPPSGPPMITDAGNSSFGIQTQVGHPGVDSNERTATWFQMEFEVLTQIIA